MDSTVEAMIEKLKPGIVETYILPGALLFVALKGTGLGRWTKRALMITGGFMLIRNYGKYKEKIHIVQESIPTLLQNPSKAIIGGLNNIVPEGVILQ